ncbi:MAG: hypothetical protein ACE37K_11245 [Planctomycetota bacterium]
MTNGQLAKALGVSVRTIERDRAKGMPLPANGEAIKAWAKRAKAWRAEQRRIPGPRKAKASIEEQKPSKPLERKRLADAKRAELELAKAEGLLHSKEECEREDAQRWAQVMNALRMLGPRLARRLGNVNPTPEFVQEVYDEEMSLAIETLKRESVA